MKRITPIAVFLDNTLHFECETEKGRVTIAGGTALHALIHGYVPTGTGGNYKLTEFDTILIQSMYKEVCREQRTI